MHGPVTEKSAAPTFDEALSATVASAKGVDILVYAGLCLQGAIDGINVPPAGSGDLKQSRLIDRDSAIVLDRPFINLSSLPAAKALSDRFASLDDTNIRDPDTWEKIATMQGEALKEIRAVVSEFSNAFVDTLPESTRENLAPNFQKKGIMEQLVYIVIDEMTRPLCEKFAASNEKVRASLDARHAHTAESIMLEQLYTTVTRATTIEQKKSPEDKEQLEMGTEDLRQELQKILPEHADEISEIYKNRFIQPAYDRVTKGESVVFFEPDPKTNFQVIRNVAIEALVTEYIKRIKLQKDGKNSEELRAEINALKTSIDALINVSQPESKEKFSITNIDIKDLREKIDYEINEQKKNLVVPSFLSLKQAFNSIIWDLKSNSHHKPLRELVIGARRGEGLLAIVETAEKAATPGLAQWSNTKARNLSTQVKELSVEIKQKISADKKQHTGKPTVP